MENIINNTSNKELIITKFRTGIIIENYDLHDSSSLEKYMNVYDVYKKKFYMELFIHNPINKTLKLPRISDKALKIKLNKDELNYTINDRSDIYNPPKYNKLKFRPEFIPRDDHQKKTINLLTNSDESRIIIGLATGFGKTYCAIKSIDILQLVPLVICRLGLIMNWINMLKQYTYYNDSDSYIISGMESIDELLSTKNYSTKFFFATPNTLSAYIQNGNDLNNLLSKLGIGVKIIDEVHTFLKSNSIIDSSCNIQKNWYLSATPSRTQQTEYYKFKQIFHDVPVFGEYTHSLNNHYNIIYVNYNTIPSLYDIDICSTARGFNTKIYFRYIFSNNNRRTFFVKMITYFIDNFYNKHNNGKILIFLDRLVDIDFVHNILSRLYNSVGKYCTLIKSKEREKELDKDIIISTLKSAVEGLNIKELRLILSLTSFSSHIYATQLIGRLRQLKDEVFLIDFNDIGFEDLTRQREKRKLHFNKNAKTIKTISLTYKDILGIS